MKLLNKALTSAMIIGAMFMANGCSTMEAVTGKDYASMDHTFANVEPSLSQKSSAKFDRSKAYVAMNHQSIANHMKHPSALWEVIDGKVVLAGLIKEVPGRVILEVTPGEHTYIKYSTCGLYSVTIDVKQGYIYQIQPFGIGSPGLMSWCKFQGTFKMDNGLSYRHRISYQNFTLVEGTEELAAEEVADSGMQEMYDDFIANTDEINPAIKLYISGNEGERIQ